MKKRNHHRKARRTVRALRREVARLKASAPCRPAVSPLPSYVLMYESEYEVVRAETARFPHCETGGMLYGWQWGEIPVIAFATTPGESAVHRVTSFLLDPQQVAEVTVSLAQRGVQDLGSWHSHHSLGLDRPSGIDCGVMKKAFASEPTRQKILCGIATIENGEPRFGMHVFANGKPSYVTVPIRLIAGESPMRLRIEHEFLREEVRS